MQPDKQPDYPTLRAIVSIDREGYMSILNFKNSELANPGIVECYHDRCFWEGMDFEDDAGLYVAELRINDTTTNTPDGIDYDCEADITLVRVYDFTNAWWEDYKCHVRKKQ